MGIFFSDTIKIECKDCQFWQGRKCTLKKYAGHHKNPDDGCKVYAFENCINCRMYNSEQKCSVKFNNFMRTDETCKSFSRWR